MDTKDFRKNLYFFLFGLKGLNFRKKFEEYIKEDAEGISPDTVPNGLRKILAHSVSAVPYYSKLMGSDTHLLQNDPIAYLEKIPILTREKLQRNHEELKSNDLARRKWYVNHTGGSTGEPVRFIQDKQFSIHAGAIQTFFIKQLGRDIGEECVFLWGSERDLYAQSESWKAQAVNFLANTIYLNVFRMHPQRIREIIDILNQRQPKLIVSYVWSLYEIAKFAEREGIPVKKQLAIISTAGTLYPQIREIIERVFQCKVYNRYGSREMGDMACERPGVSGLWVAPWSTYMEIVDEQGNRVPDGVEGRILVTSLINYAMPLIRYDIGDIGKLVPTQSGSPSPVQVFEAILGRNSDMFINHKGHVVDSTYFLDILYGKEWISHYQVIQKAPSSLLLRFVLDSSAPDQNQLDQIARVSRRIMNDENCEVKFEFVDYIEKTPSGKFRFIMSEINK